MSPGDSLAREPAAPRRWLSIVGIGEDGLEGLTAVARGLVKDAEIVFGGKRHLGLAAALISGAARPWPSPFERAVEEVLAYRGRQVCVLASGDPFVHGVLRGTTHYYVYRVRDVFGQVSAGFSPTASITVT
jgi:precorrin-6Y C5,15-methyltransferase (decarboxylating)